MIAINDGQKNRPEPTPSGVGARQEDAHSSRRRVQPRLQKTNETCNARKGACCIRNAARRVQVPAFPGKQSCPARDDRSCAPSVVPASHPPIPYPPHLKWPTTVAPICIPTTSSTFVDTPSAAFPSPPHLRFRQLNLGSRVLSTRTCPKPLPPLRSPLHTLNPPSKRRKHTFQPHTAYSRRSTRPLNAIADPQTRQGASRSNRCSPVAVDGPHRIHPGFIRFIQALLQNVGICLRLESSTMRSHVTLSSKNHLATTSDTAMSAQFWTSVLVACQN